MKNLLVCIVVPFLVISCSNDSDGNPAESSRISGVELVNNSILPANSANPFDAIGRNRYTELDEYQKTHAVPKSAKSIQQQLSFLSDRTASFTKKDEIITTEEIAAVIEDPQNSIVEIVANSSFAGEAKLVLLEFVQNLLVQEGTDYAEQYQYIVSYEAEVLENSTLSVDEKETILTVTSISRYELYATSIHKDRDWETSVANRKVNSGLNSDRASIVSLIAFISTIL